MTDHPNPRAHIVITKPDGTQEITEVVDFTLNVSRDPNLVTAVILEGVAVKGQKPLHMPMHLKPYHRHVLTDEIGVIKRGEKRAMVVPGDKTMKLGHRYTLFHHDYKGAETVDVVVTHVQRLSSFKLEQSLVSFKVHDASERVDLGDTGIPVE